MFTLADMPAFKRKYLNNAPLTDPQGNLLTDQTLLDKVLLAKAKFERKYAVRLEPTLIRVGHRVHSKEPESQTYHTDGLTDQQIAALPKFEEVDALDFDPRAFEASRHGLIKMPVHPVKAVYGVGLELPGTLASGTSKLFELPNEWFHEKLRNGVIQVFWKASSAIPYVLPLQMPGMTFAAMSLGTSIPNTWHVSYLAGYTEADLSGQFADVLDAVNKMAAIELYTLASMDQNAALGIAGRNVSADGLSQSIQLIASGGNLKYGPMIKGIQDELDAWEKTFAHRVRGVRVGFL